MALNDLLTGAALVLAFVGGQFPGVLRDDAASEPRPAAYDDASVPRPAPRVSPYSLVVAQDVPRPARDAYRRALKRYRDGKRAEAAARLR